MISCTWLEFIFVIRVVCQIRVCILVLDLGISVFRIKFTLLSIVIDVVGVVVGVILVAIARFLNDSLNYAAFFVIVVLALNVKIDLNGSRGGSSSCWSLLAGARVLEGWLLRRALRIEAI